MARQALVLLLLVPASARRWHDKNKYKHAHTFLEFCADDTDVETVGCIHKVDVKWPSPARLAAPDCKVASTGNAISSGCAAGGTIDKNLYEPITIITGLVTGQIFDEQESGTDSWKGIQYTHGADVDTMQVWDRIRCRDGQLFSTGWYRKYTDTECARLCAKVSNFHGHTCSHFSRQWIHTKIKEHDDTCGRDGDGGDGVGTTGSYGSGGVGHGPDPDLKYTYKGQCIFFDSPNRDCCATKVGWQMNLDGTASSTHCTDKYGSRTDKSVGGDNWDSKHRSWRLSQDTAVSLGFTPSAPWPIVNRAKTPNPLGINRRLAEADIETEDVHEFFFPNGSSFWAFGNETMSR
jgi:hypothetical protein